MPGLRIGELLVEQGLLLPIQVQQILNEQRQSARPFGDLAERLFGVSPKAIEDAWVRQYASFAGVVDISQVKVEAGCLRLLNRRQAWQFKLLPLDYDEQGDLRVATDQDHLVGALNFASRTFDDPVLMVLAERRQLRDFLMKHYPVPEHIAEFSEKLATGV